MSTPAAMRLPPMDRVHNHAAAELLELLSSDGYDALVSACADPAVRDATARLLEALVAARDRRVRR